MIKNEIVKQKRIKKHVVKIITNTTIEITDLMNKIADCFETKQYHLILLHLNEMEKIITEHKVKIDLLCIHWGKWLDEETIKDYQTGNRSLSEKFTDVHQNVMKDVISCYNLDGNEFH